MTQSTWDQYFFNLCNAISTKSNDQSTKVGAVIVGPHHEIRSTGWNDFPRGVIDNIQERRKRPTKYDFTEHAERNAIYNAARVGTPLHACSLYVPWFPCVDCARAIIQVGIVELICCEPDFSDKRWGQSHLHAATMFEESGIRMRYVDLNQHTG